MLELSVCVALVRLPKLKYCAENYILKVKLYLLSLEYFSTQDRWSILSLVFSTSVSRAARSTELNIIMVLAQWKWALIVNSTMVTSNCIQCDALPAKTGMNHLPFLISVKLSFNYIPCLSHLKKQMSSCRNIVSWKRASSLVIRRDQT